MSALHGPFETEREALAAAVAVAGIEAGDVYSSADNERILLGVLKTAGVTLGAYDRAIVMWLAGWERATCAVIAGLISRAHGPTPTGDPFEDYGFGRNSSPEAQ